MAIRWKNQNSLKFGQTASAASRSSLTSCSTCIMPFPVSPFLFDKPYKIGYSSSTSSQSYYEFLSLRTLSCFPTVQWCSCALAVSQIPLFFLRVIILPLACSNTLANTSINFFSSSKSYRVLHLCPPAIDTRDKYKVNMWMQQWTWTQTWQ